MGFNNYILCAALYDLNKNKFQKDFFQIVHE